MIKSVLIFCTKASQIESRHSRFPTCSVVVLFLNSPHDNYKILQTIGEWLYLVCNSHTPSWFQDMIVNINNFFLQNEGKLSRYGRFPSSWASHQQNVILQVTTRTMFDGGRPNSHKNFNVVMSMYCTCIQIFYTLKVSSLTVCNCTYTIPIYKYTCTLVK